MNELVLTLADELALVALRPDGGAWVEHYQLECGLDGAILAELALAQKIGLRGKALVVPTISGKPDL